nr:bifunctional nuclease 2-like isoform X1 [Ipomoea trifida]
MNSLQGPVVCPVVHAKRTGPYSVPVKPSALVKASKILRSEFWRLDGIHCRQAHFPLQQHSRISKLIACGFSSSSNGNGSRAENFNENDADYVNSSVVEAVEVRSSPDGFMIKMRDGRELRCFHNNPQSGHLPDYAPHAAIVLRMEDEIGLLLPIIVLEMSSMLLMEAICDVQIARPTVYQVVKDMIEKMGYEVKLVRITKRVHEAYFARLYLTKQLDNRCESISFDLRPSDAINIAVRCKVPIQVNKHLAFSDGMRITESAKPLMQGSSDGLLLTGLDRPTGQPCIEAEEFILLRNMLIAAAEERYKDAVYHLLVCSSVEGQAHSTSFEEKLDIAGRNSFDKANCNHNCSRMKMNCVYIAEDICGMDVQFGYFSHQPCLCMNMKMMRFPSAISASSFFISSSAISAGVALTFNSNSSIFWYKACSSILSGLVFRFSAMQDGIAVNIFNHEDGAICRADEQPSQIRVALNLSQIEVVDIKIEDVREVSPKHNVFVLVVKAQLEISLLCFRIAVAISFADLLDCCGFQFPHHLHLVVEINDFLIPIDGDDQFLVFLRLDHFDSSRCFGDLSSEEEHQGQWSLSLLFLILTSSPSTYTLNSENPLTPLFSATKITNRKSVSLALSAFKLTAGVLQAVSKEPEEIDLSSINTPSGALMKDILFNCLQKFSGYKDVNLRIQRTDKQRPLTMLLSTGNN